MQTLGLVKEPSASKVTPLNIHVFHFGNSSVKVTTKVVLAWACIPHIASKHALRVLLSAARRLNVRGFKMAAAELKVQGDKTSTDIV
jgi:hypothetical protein